MPTTSFFCLYMYMRIDVEQKNESPDVKVAEPGDKYVFGVKVVLHINLG